MEQVHDRQDIVLLSTADWDNPTWTNKQHVAITLAQRGHRVLYVESPGLRRPTATLRDARRIASRLRKAAAGPQLVRDNLWVWSPLLLPRHDLKLARLVNRRLFGWFLGRQIARLGFRRELLWTYNPITPLLVDLTEFARTVYHCVDDISTQPRMPTEVLDHGEHILLVKSDLVFTTAPSLTDKCREYNDRTFFFSNVCDFGHFSQALAPETVVPADLLKIPEPRIGFVGAVSGYKVDFELLAAAADAKPHWSFVLIGNVGEGDPHTDVSILRNRANIHLLGPRPYETLPAYLKGMQVTLLPSRLNEYTRSMFPMKFFEYLASGRPIVSTDLPALQQHRDIAAFTTSPPDFIAAIDAALAGRAAPLDMRLSAARRNTYEVRTAAMLALLDEPGTAAVEPTCLLTA